MKIFNIFNKDFYKQLTAVRTDFLVPANTYRTTFMVLLYVRKICAKMLSTTANVINAKKYKNCNFQQHFFLYNNNNKMM